MRSRKSYGRPVALCGMMAALSVTLMHLGVIIPIMLYVAPMAACILVMFVCVECGLRFAWAEYAAAALLAVLFVPDKEIAFVFAFLGYYPLIKPKFDRLHPKLICTAAKLVYFNAAILAMYVLLYSMFFPGQLFTDLKDAGLLLTAVTLLVGNIAFFALDRALLRFLYLYRMVWQKRLHRMLGWH